MEIKDLPAGFWKRPPWDHQREIFAKAAPETDYALFAEMGTGKTFTTVNILRWLYLKEKRVLRTLIFGPAAVCEAWRREFVASSKIGKQVRVLGGAGIDRLADVMKYGFPDQFGETPCTVFVTNYETLDIKRVVEILIKWNPEVVVFDESHRLKNHKAKRFKTALKLADPAKHRYILTGTPVLNDGRDLWAQFRVLDGGKTFGTNPYAFQARYFIDKNAGMRGSHAAAKYFPKWVPIEGSEEELNRLLYRKSTRVLKRDCLSLPPVVRTTRYCQLSPKQAKAYAEMKAHFLAYIDDKACVAHIALTKALRLQQIVSGHYVDDEGVTHEFDDVPRLEDLFEDLETVIPKHKAIVWSAFRNDADRICGRLLDQGIEHRYLVGGMTAKLRQESIDAFKLDPKVRVFVANPQAGGVGVDGLQVASYAFYYSRNFSLEADLQSEARFHRGGSEIHESLTRVDLVTPGTIDETVLEALKRKEDLAEKILALRKI